MVRLGSGGGGLATGDGRRQWLKGSHGAGVVQAVESMGKDGDDVVMLRGCLGGEESNSGGGNRPIAFLAGLGEEEVAGRLWCSRD